MGCGSSSAKGKVSAAPSPEINNMEQHESTDLVPTYVSFNQFMSTDKPQIEEWRFVREFGKGATSHVYLVENEKTQEHAAAKVYSLISLNKQTLRNEEPPIKAVQTEIELMMELENSYLLSIIEAIEDEITQSLIIVMPFAQNGNVQDLLDKGKMDQTMIAVCFHEIGQGLVYLHENNIVHRDIKPENFLCFQEDYYVLSDFSVSTRLEDNPYLSDTKGSPAFLSPEECSVEKFEGKPADVWAYGVSLYSAVYGKLPFKLDCGGASQVANTVLLVTQQLENESLEFPERDDVDPLVEDLLRQILDKDPTKRPKMEEILQHPYFRDCWEIEKALDEQLEIPEEEEDVNNGEEQNNAGGN